MSGVTCSQPTYDGAWRGINQRYLTPPDTPTDYICRRIRFPDEPQFRMALIELISRLAFCDTWDTSGGGITSEAAAALGSAIVDSWNESEDSCVVLPVGAINPYAGGDLPEGFLWCDGAQYLIADYPALAAVLHENYLDVDGIHFHVPEMRERFPKGWNGETVGDDTGTEGGAAEITLEVDQLPAHNHGVTDPGHNHTQNAHNHGVTDPGHNHTQNGHTHDITHGHGFFGRTSATGFGTTNRTAMADHGGANSTPSTQSQTTTTSGSTTPTNNSNTTGLTVNNATPTNNSNTTGITTNNTGDGLGIPIMPSWHALRYIIRAA